MTISGLRFLNLNVDGTGRPVFISGTDDVTISNCIWDNVGPNACVAVQNALTDDAKRFTLSGSSFVNMNHLWSYRVTMTAQNTVDLEKYVISNCVFNEPDQIGDDTGGAAGVLATQCDSVTIRGCTGYNAGNTGGTLDGPDFLHFTGVCDRIAVIDCSFIRYNQGLASDDSLAASDAIVFDGAVIRDSVWIADCAFTGAGRGIYAYNTDEVTVSNVVADSCLSHAFACSTNSLNMFTHCRASASGGDGIRITASAQMTIEHCTFVRSAGFAYYHDGLGGEDVVKNNIFSEAAAQIAHLGDETNEIPPDMTFTNNLWWDSDGILFEVCDPGGCSDLNFAGWQALSYGLNSQAIQPKFKNVNGRAYPLTSLDFCLFCGSPGIGDGDDGLNVGALDTFCPGGGRTSHGKGKGK
jgi:hypothetical protein